jgi:hypothetical protein
LILRAFTISYYCSSEFFASCEELSAALWKSSAVQHLITKERKNENTKKRVDQWARGPAHESQRPNAVFQSCGPLTLIVFFVFSVFRSFVIRIDCGLAALCFRVSHWFIQQFNLARILTEWLADAFRYVCEVKQPREALRLLIPPTVSATNIVFGLILEMAIFVKLVDFQLLIGENARQG